MPELIELITELLMPPIPKAHISGDIVLLDIEGVVPGWGTYMFSLDVVEPGQKVSCLLSFHCFQFILTSKLFFASSIVLLRPTPYKYESFSPYTYVLT